MKKVYKISIAIALLIAMLVFTTVIAEDPVRKSANTIASLMEIIREEYYKDVDTDKLERGAIDGMFEKLDPHSTYFDRKELDDFMDETSGEFGGIGAQIEAKDDYIAVVSPIEDTPAYKAGLKTGDIIVSVDGTDLKGYSANKAVSIIRGEAGTKVKLGIKKSGLSDIKYITITREIIKIESVKTKTPFNTDADAIINDKNIGYIRVAEFTENTYVPFAQLVAKYKAEGKKGLIIDLRGNPGGLLTTVVNMCKLVVPKGPIVHIDAKGTEEDQTYSSNLEQAPFKIAVLVNEGSASASEIMTGAIKDSKAGIVVGTKTYGKGTVQSIIRLIDGGGLKVTIAEYMTRNKIHINGKGIEPDYKVETSQEEKSLAEIEPYRDLKNGLWGIDIYSIQQRLKNLGYDVKVDGVMGDATLKAAAKLLKKEGYKEPKLLNIEAQKNIMEAYDKEKYKLLYDKQLEKAASELKKLIAKK